MPDTPLRNLDPVALARDTVQTALDRAHTMVMAIEVGATISIKVHAPHEATPLGHAIQCLTRYAQTGAPLDAPLSEYCITLVAVCSEEIDDSQSREPKTDLGRIIAAAQARDDAERGEPVRIVGLACLGDVIPRYVRRLSETGELRESERGYVRSDDARRWLSARGIVVERRR